MHVAQATAAAPLAYARIDGIADDRVMAAGLAGNGEFVAAIWCGWDARGQPDWMLSCCRHGNKATARAREIAGTRRLRLLLVHGLARAPSPKQYADFAALQTAAAGILRLELWHIGRLQYDPLAVMRHIVPPQRRATPDEIAGLGSQRHALPRARADDAMVRWLGLGPGDILRSIRHDGKPYYRLVTAAAAASK